MIDIERTREFEGKRVDGSGRHIPYKDSSGILTIGYGHNLSHGISERAAELIFLEDIDAAQKILDEMMPDLQSAPDTVRSVLLDMAFNMGWGDGARGLSSLKRFLASINSGNYREASDILWQPGVPRDRQALLYARQVGDRARRNADMLRYFDSRLV